MGLKEFFFGKQIVFSDKLIGNLETRIKIDNPTINYTWVGETQLTGQKRKTVFILEGNSQGPYKNQLKSVQRIVQNIENITKEIDLELKAAKSVKLRFKHNWVKDFYLAAITPNDTRENKFEVNFEPIDENDSGYVLFLWANDRISEIESK